jgi:5'-nucleotidase
MLEGGSMVAHLLCRAMLQKAAQEGIYADMALINAGSVRGDIKAGKITAGDVYRLMPFETTMQLVKLSGKQVCLALEQGLESALGRGRAGAFPCVAGARYLADSENPENLRLRDLQISGKDAMFYPVDPGRSYLVLTNGFLARGGDGYRVFKTAGRKAYDTGLTDADIFMDYVKSKEVLEKPVKTGITLITGEDPGYTDPEK